MSRRYDVNARGRVQQIQELLVGRGTLPLAEAEQLAGVSARQIRRDLQRHPEAGLAVVRGKVVMVDSAPLARSAPRTRRPGLQEERWLDLLDLLRYGPITRDRLQDLWGATPDEISTDIAALLQEGYVRRSTRGTTMTYDLGTALVPSAPWERSDVQALLSFLAQIWPRYAEPPANLVSARAKLEDWIRALGAPVCPHRPPFRVMKGPLRYANVLVEDRVTKLEEAVRAACRVRLRYRGDPEERLVEPLGLVYYWVTDAWYLVVSPLPDEQEPRLLRVDRIARSRVLSEHFAYPATFSLEQHFRLSWGVETGPTSVLRVRFYDEAGVVARLQREVAHRLAPQGQAQIHQVPGAPHVLYSDEVAGQHEVRHWLRTFGSSAVVEEPAAMRREMAGRARQLLEVYEREPF